MEKLKQETIDTTIIDVRNYFRLEKKKKKLKAEYLETNKKGNKVIKDIILREIRNSFENEEEENYYKPVRVSNFWSNNYNEYESNSDRNKSLSVEEYLNENKPNLKDIINNLKNVTRAKKFISSKDNNEEHVMHSKSDKIEIIINDEADEVIKALFKSLTNRYKNNLESMKGSEFVFDYVDLLYYKCHKRNPNHI